VNRGLALGLLLASSQASAVLLGSEAGPQACGSTLRAAAIERMKAGVREANAKVLEHFGRLNRDVRTRRDAAEADAVTRQLGSLIDIMQAVQGASSALESAALLAAVREQTVYGGDRVAAGLRLSAALYRARREAETSYRRIGPALAGITLPGIAADAAKLRDAVASVIASLGNCILPAR